MRRDWTAGIISAIALGVLLVLGSCSRGQPEAQTKGHSHLESPAVRYPEVSGLRVVSRETMSPPLLVPPFRLTGHSGQVVDISDLRGSVVLLSFTYTNCPEACPLLTGHYLRLQEEFAQEVEEGALRLLFTTTDPERDTPARLQQYTEGLGGRWSFLTGSLSELERVWHDYGIHREVQERNREVVVYHSYKTFLLDRDGLIRVRYTGVWHPEEVTSDIRSLLAGH